MKYLIILVLVVGIAAIFFLGMLVLAEIKINTYETTGEEAEVKK